jgi:hypothetical protein
MLVEEGAAAGPGVGETLQELETATAVGFKFTLQTSDHPARASIKHIFACIANAHVGNPTPEKQGMRSNLKKHYL